MATRASKSPRRASEMGKGSQMVYCGKKIRQIERESLVGLCREYTLTPILGCPLMRCRSSVLALALSLRLLSVGVVGVVLVSRNRT